MLLNLAVKVYYRVWIRHWYNLVARSADIVISLLSGKLCMRVVDKAV